MFRDLSLLKSIREIATQPSTKRSRTFLQLASLCGVLSLTACGPKQQTYWGGNIDMGPIPNDVCKIEGKAQILNVSTESTGDVHMIYLRNNGDYVSQRWTRSALGFGTDYVEAGSVFWTGGVCPGSDVPPRATETIRPTLQPFPTPRSPFIDATPQPR
jgi:hypothetical protein